MNEYLMVAVKRGFTSEETATSATNMINDHIGKGWSLQSVIPVGAEIFVTFGRP